MELLLWAGVGVLVETIEWAGPPPSRWRMPFMDGPIIIRDPGEQYDPVYSIKLERTFERITHYHPSHQRAHYMEVRK